MGTESLRTYNKIEPSSYYVKDKLLQVIEFSVLMLWIIVYVIKSINFSEYEDDSLLNDGSLIKSILVLAAFSFILSIVQGTWAYYKIKCAYSNDPSKWIIRSVKSFTSGFFFLMMPIPLILFPESDRLFEIYLIALLYAGSYVRAKTLNKIETEHERKCM